LLKRLRSGLPCGRGTGGPAAGEGRQCGGVRVPGGSV